VDEAPPATDAVAAEGDAPLPDAPAPGDAISGAPADAVEAEGDAAAPPDDTPAT
jgi:hypothetical protein